MKEIVKNIYHVGDSGCSVYLINTNSKDTDGLILQSLAIEAILTN